jgi:glycosyltransferase involved in cell wall biosynthesis
MKIKLLIFHPIATSYYKNIVFNELYKKHDNLKIIHLAETDKKRDWKVDFSDIYYNYEILTKGNMSDKGKVFYIKKVWNILNKEKPKLVYTGGYFHIAYWIALLWSKFYNAKVIVEMDSNKFDHKRVFWKEWIKKLYISSCNLGITYGKLSKEYLIDLGMPSEKIVIKPNVSSKVLFNTDSNNKPTIFEDNKKYFIYVGRFAEEKNLIRLLEAFKISTVNNKDWCLVLVGSGPDEIKLKDYINAHQIQNVIFTGFVDKNDLKNYYINSDVFILPSIKEPWGLVANEAMMCGLPVMISKQCGCSYDLVDHNGYIFDPFDLDDMTEKMSIFINYTSKDDIKMKNKSIEIIDKFTPTNAADNIIEAIKKLEG